MQAFLLNGFNSERHKGMFIKPKQASILWTGEKDSALALYDAQLMGYDVVNLLTFAPSGRELLRIPS